MADAICCSTSNFSYFELRDLSKDKVLKEMKPFRNSLTSQCLTSQFQEENGCGTMTKQQLFTIRIFLLVCLICLICSTVIHSVAAS